MRTCECSCEGCVWCALSHSSPPRRYVSDPDTDTADTLNAALSAGLHLVISPGIYTLSAPLVVEKENQVLLGLGLATLICPPSGNACIQVADVSGARVAGVLLQAGKYVRLRAAPTTSCSCAKEWAGGAGGREERASGAKTDAN